MSKTYGSKNKQQAAAAAVARARATILNSRRSIAPPRTGGYYGLYTQRGRDELKVIDTQVVTAPVLTAGTATLLNGVAQGTDFTDRIGRKVNIRSIHLKYYIQAYNSVDVPLGDIFRIMLVWDYQTNGALAAVTDILTTADVLSGVNLTNRDRFKVLYDKRHTMGAIEYSAAAVAGGDSTPKFAQRYIKCNYPMVFGGTGATVGSIQTGSLILVTLMSTSATGFASNTRVRCRFSDS